GPAADSNGVSGPIAPAATPNASSQPVATSRFLVDVRQQSEVMWRARAAIPSYFGADHLLGIDMGLDNSEDSPIVAAADGVVEFAGGSPCCEEGLHVVINHEGNRSTLYGHLSRLDVSTGQEVMQGQQLGLG